MKKGLLLFPLILALASCNGSNSITNQEAVNELKELLNKQDLSDFTSKGLATMFTQEFDVLEVSKDQDEEESRSSYFSYSGLGFLDAYYELDKDEYDEIVDDNGGVNIFDAIALGEGGYRITQSADTVSSLRESGSNYSVNNLDIIQQMTLKSTEEDVIVYNTLNITDHQIYDASSSQLFNGSINKELLFGSVSTRSFRDIFSNVNLFDSPGNIEYLDRLYFSICRDLKNRSDKEISDFITENDIVFEEVEGDIELSFVYKNDNIDEDYIDYIFPGAIKGKLIYDKETGSFDEFNYEIKYVNESYDEETGNIKTANMIFVCYGRSSRGAMGDMWTPDDPTIYEDVISYLEDVGDEVIPPTLF